MDKLLKEIKNFTDNQKKDWDLANKNYLQLANVKTKSFSINGNRILAQFNPERIKSTTAAVDKTSIAKRKCFLCKENRPKEQKDFIINSNYNLLVNPFPIFETHFTICFNDHKSQLIQPNLDDLIEIISKIEKAYTIFYNGPECGASAPDHMHFQACHSSVLPIEGEFYSKKKFSKLQIRKNDVEINFIDDSLRKYISFEFSSPQSIKSELTKIISILNRFDNSELEPKLNLISFYNKTKTVLVIPREVHRPGFYFDKEDELLISPASVDMGGIVICPREIDFNVLGEDKIAQMFNEVCYSEEKFEKLISLCNSY